MKQVYLFLVMLFVANSVYSQDNEWYWNEETKDVVYETPNSKFVKKWYRWNESFELLANGTFKMTQRNWVEDYGLYSIIYFSGTWKRTDKMTLEIRWSNVTYTGDQTAVSKLSARKRDELKKVFAEASRVWKAKYVGKTEKYSILRIDNDHLILRRYDVQKWYSEKRKKEYELQRQKEAEEARRAAEAKTAKIYDVVEVEEEPQFPGGPSALSEYLSQNIHYPVVAEENGIQGQVIVTFVVEMDGSLSDVKVVKGVELPLNKEALRVVRSMPKWIPGKANGKAVRVKYTMPVTFKLQ